MVTLKYEEEVVAGRFMPVSKAPKPDSHMELVDYNKKGLQMRPKLSVLHREKYDFTDLSERSVNHGS
jgi:hypothetical protein